MSNADAFREFAKLQAQLAGLANGRVAREIRQEVAKETVQLIKTDFRAERTPYGSAWPERKKPYPWPMLRKSGKLFGAPLDGVRYSVRGLAVVINLPYAKAQNYGYPPRNLPARQYLPDPAKPMPARWERAWKAASERVLSRWLGERVKAA